MHFVDFSDELCWKTISFFKIKVIIAVHSTTVLVGRVVVLDTFASQDTFVKDSIVDLILHIETSQTTQLCTFVIAIVVEYVIFEHHAQSLPLRYVLVYKTVVSVEGVDLDFCKASSVA